MKTEFVFLASGLMFERVKGNDFTAIEYKNIVNVEREEDTDHFNIYVLDGDSDTDPYLIQCTDAQERIALMGELRKRKEEWLEREAVQREEDNRDVLRAPRSAQIPRSARHFSHILANSPRGLRLIRTLVTRHWKQLKGAKNEQEGERNKK